MKIWDVKSQVCRHCFFFCFQPLFFSSDFTFITSADWQTNVAKFEGHVGAVTSISFSENGYFLAVGAPLRKKNVDRELCDIMFIYFTFELDRLQPVMALSCGIYANWKTSGHSLHMVLTHQQTVVCVSTSLLIVSFPGKMRSISLQCFHFAKFCWITWKQLNLLGVLGWHGEFLVDIYMYIYLILLAR